MEISWELNLSLENLLVDSHGIIVIERIDSSQHLVGEDAHRPPVDGLAMAFVEEHFGGEVLRRTAKRISARLAIFGEAEIGELEIALLVNENVLWLEIAVDNVQGVEILEHESHLR